MKEEKLTKPEDVKIVFPVDVTSLEEARELMHDVGEFIDVPKIGHKLIHSVGTPAAIAVIKEFGKMPFFDGKLIDIPETIREAAKAITKHGVDSFNVMACGGRPMMEAAMEGADSMARELGIERPKVIAVTVLTSLKLAHLVELQICPAKFLLLNEDEQAMILAEMSEEHQQEAITEIVMNWSHASVMAGVDILLSSARESAAIHARWPSIDLYSPGIRMPYSPPDDQGRTLSPGEAVLNGVKYLVIGRPIRNPEGDRTRQKVIEEIRMDIINSLPKKEKPASETCWI